MPTLYSLLERRPNKAARFVSAGPAILGVAAVVLVAGGYGYDLWRSNQARTEVAEAWTQGLHAMTIHLHQQRPLNLGAIWATHNKVICGTVEGRFSFPGMTGMTPFFIRKSVAVFQADTPFDVFTPTWRTCIADHWITLRNGSEKSGYCATPKGRNHCRPSLYFD